MNDRIQQVLNQMATLEDELRDALHEQETQALCFPVYRIVKVRRADYIVLDRHQLGYLNLFEKIHCNYCGYASGLVAYVYEILARTEQYFCPIKHARRILGIHSRYRRFLDYGEAADYAARVEAFRVALGRMK